LSLTYQHAYVIAAKVYPVNAQHYLGLFRCGLRGQLLTLMNSRE